MQTDTFMAQQFLFQRQWQRIRKYAQKLGIYIMGDMPTYVGYHSADVWANKKLFLPVYLNYFLKAILLLLFGNMYNCFMFFYYALWLQRTRMVSSLLLVVFHLMHSVKRVNYGTISIFLLSILFVFVILYHTYRVSPYRFQFCSPLYD
jgi:hypothetical protein